VHVHGGLAMTRFSSAGGQSNTVACTRFAGHMLLSWRRRALLVTAAGSTVVRVLILAPRMCGWLYCCCSSRCCCWIPLVCMFLGVVISCVKCCVCTWSGHVLIVLWCAIRLCACLIPCQCGVTQLHSVTAGTGADGQRACAHQQSACAHWFAAVQQPHTMPTESYDAKIVMQTQ
jgi:hypothetical protein